MAKPRKDLDYRLLFIVVRDARWCFRTVPPLGIVGKMSVMLSSLVVNRHLHLLLSFRGECVPTVVV